ncbi:carbohydrate sulfotransferase 11-like isoform X2 [Littorina saxatilis]|uniref:carbohydrate sulfotransferase 11-like isoform X2 n=1 Tax=Littorina saxatilis TaxID=31220 RepID=UPI0038B6A3B1
MLRDPRLNKKFLGLVVVGVMLPLLLFYAVSGPHDTPSSERSVKLIHKGHYLSNANNTILFTDQAPPTTPSQQAVLAEHVRRTCQKQDRRQTTSVKFNPKHYDHILVDDRHKMLYCYVPKVACTNWKRVMLVLSGKVKVNNVLDITAVEVHNRYKDVIPLLSNYPKSEIKYRLDNYYKFMFVREPFERLLSAWRNKFHSNVSSSLYFRKQFGRSILRRFRDSKEIGFAAGGGGKSKTDAELEKVRVRFDEFLQYLVDPVRTEELNEHWAKYHKLCRPCSVQYDFVGKYETIDEDAEHVLRSVLANHMVNFPKRSATYRHNRTASYFGKFYDDVPPSLLRRVFKAYKLDFDMFDYSVPEELQKRFEADDDDVDI